MAGRTVQGIFSAPIDFYAKVQDQYGAPVAGAKVEYGAIDKFWDDASKYHGESDDEGRFSIEGIKGAGLGVGVSKYGYSGLKGQSYQTFGYGMPSDEVCKPPPTAGRPAIFVLRKMAPAEPLYSFDRSVILQKDGTPVAFNLKTTRPIPFEQGAMVLECWMADQEKDAKGHYEWHFRLTVPGGGVVKREDLETSFEAPETGYLPTLEKQMSPSTEHWQGIDDGEYWVKLGDGTYARMRLRVMTGGRVPFASVTSFLNPKRGSRNLEFDEAQKIFAE